MRTRGWIATVVIVVAATAAGLFLRRDPPPCAAEQALGRVLPEVRFDETPFDQAVAALSRQAGTDILIDVPALQAARVDAAQPVDLRLRNFPLDEVLTHLLGYVSGNTSDPLVHTVFQNRIVITAAGNTGTYGYARVYDVRDIVVQLPETVGESTGPDCFGGGSGAVEPMTRRDQDEELLRTILEVTGSDVWDSRNDPSRSTRSLHGRLLIVTSWRGHRAVARLLDQLRHACNLDGESSCRN
jgi:hypothetical protein